MLALKSDLEPPQNNPWNPPKCPPNPAGQGRDHGGGGVAALKSELDPLTLQNQPSEPPNVPPILQVKAGIMEVAEWLLH